MQLGDDSPAIMGGPRAKLRQKGFDLLHGDNLAIPMLTEEKTNTSLLCGRQTRQDLRLSPRPGHLALA